MRILSGVRRILTTREFPLGISIVCGIGRVVILGTVRVCTGYNRVRGTSRLAHTFLSRACGSVVCFSAPFENSIVSRSSLSAGVELCRSTMRLTDRFSTRLTRRCVSGLGTVWWPRYGKRNRGTPPRTKNVPLSRR